jgi:hypothetical protein
MKTYLVTLTVTVHDRAALARAARRHAIEIEKLQSSEWHKMRRDHPGGVVCADLLMLLDPGESPDGIEIVSGDAKEDRA